MPSFAQIFGGLLVCIGAVIAAQSCWGIVQAVLSKSWPTTTGSVVVSRLQESNDDTVTYRAEVTYAYVVDGIKHVGNGVRFGSRFGLSWPGPAFREIRKYPVGTVVEVHFDPSDPSRSVIEPGIGSSLMAGLALAAVFFLFGAGLIVIGG